jgi:hypothetical protein
MNMRRFRQYTVAAAALALVLVSGASSAPTAPPLAKARLQGNFDVVTRITSAKGIDAESGEKDEFVWGFRPRSSSGASDVRLTFRYRGASFDTHRLSMQLEQSGASYAGTGTATFLECFYKDVRGPVTIRLRVLKAALIGGVWRATAFKGTYVHTTQTSTSSIYTCPGARLNVSFWASLPR